MELTQPPLYMKMVTLIGCMCINVPSSVEWYWGGVSVYAYSYVISHQDLDSGVGAPWIISLFIILLTAGTVAGGFLAKYVRRQVIMVTGSILVNAAAFLSYFAIQKSLAMLTLCIGLLIGGGTGLLYGVSIHFVVQTAGKDVGLLTSVLLTSYSLGGFLIVQLITQFVNPENFNPELRLGATNYFTQTTVLDRVPSMFLILGFFTTAMHFVGYILLQFNPNIRFINCSADDVSGKTNLHEANGQSTDRSQMSCCDDTALDTHSSESFLGSTGDFTPKEMLKTLTFYVMCIAFSIGGLSYIMLINYYKLYGQVWIHDDHFLSNLGTAFVLVTSIARVVWGLTCDKFTPKQVLFALHSSMAISTTLYYFTAQVDRWLYAFATLVYGSMAGALYTCYLGVIARVFGKTHVSTNYGLIISVFAAFNLIAPYIINVILTNFGWFATFATGGGLNIISEALCLIFIA